MSLDVDDQTREFLGKIMRCLAEFYEAATDQFGPRLAEQLTIAYLDKLVPDAQPQISPDVARVYERLGTSMTKMAAAVDE